MQFENIDGRPKGRGTAGWFDIGKVLMGTEPLPMDINTGNILYCSVLYALAVAEQPKVVVDIGTQLGLSARMWLAASPEATVHSIDTDLACGELKGKLSPEHAERWHFHHGRSQDIDPIACDLLYVDGDHSYEVVCSDMARFGSKVRDGGLVVLDDYHHTWPGKMRWVDERWDELDPIIIGPTAVVRVTAYKRRLFTKVFLP